MAAEEAAATPAHAKKGGMGKKLLMGGIVLALVGGGGAWWMMRGASAEAAPKEVSAEERGLLSLEPFLVNLADAGGTRFLKATIQLVLESEEDAKHVEETKVLLMQVRSAILELLTEQNAQALVTPEGKQALRLAIKEHATEQLEHRKVIDVLFSEFVVQF